MPVVCSVVACGVVGTRVYVGAASQCAHFVVVKSSMVVVQCWRCVGGEPSSLGVLLVVVGVGQCSWGGGYRCSGEVGLCRVVEVVA